MRLDSDGLEYSGWGEDDQTRVYLTRCPACGVEFSHRSLGPHDEVGLHLLQHEPEDFGLSPIGERNVDDREPVFVPDGGEPE